MGLAMATAYIGIGSNLGDRRGNCMYAAQRAGEIPGCTLLAVSGWFMTSPVGNKDQDWFVNGVVVLSAEISAEELLKGLLAVERDMGRVRAEKWGPRVIDLDILLFGREVIVSADLTVPHPEMHRRRFVLVPMVQVAPDLVHPTRGETMTELLNRVGENGQVVSPIEA